jgi:hypothetical protein
MHGRPEAGPGGADATLRAVMDRLSGLPGALRQQLNDHLWQAIAADNWESAYAVSQTANVALSVQPKTAVIFRVECVVASIPSLATGIVQLGDVTIPFSGLLIIPGLRLQLNSSDLRAVTATTTGPVSLLITGEQLPPWGQMSR